MTAIMKAMGENGNGASAFMEDYTYHLVEGQEYSLGAHMLEVCPSLAEPNAKLKIETHHLGIGMNEKDPARRRGMLDHRRRRTPYCSVLRCHC